MSPRPSSPSIRSQKAARSLHELIDEKYQLDLKLDELEESFNTKEFKELPLENGRLLLRQAAAMREYSSILDQRIGKFG